MPVALAAVCSASGTPVSGSGSSGRSTSHLCLVKLPTGRPIASVEKTNLCVCVVVCGWLVSFLASCAYTHGLSGLILGKASTSPQGFCREISQVGSLLLADGLLHFTSFLWVNGLIIRVKGFFNSAIYKCIDGKQCSGDIVIYTS